MIMASGGDELEKIVKILKSLIVPVKGGLHITQLEREYKLNEGRPIPLAKHGFSSITALVRSIPEIRISTEGNLTVQSATLAHLTDLVARQKNTKSKGKKFPRLQTARTYGARSASSYSGRPYASAGTPVRRPVLYQRSYNAPTTNRTHNNIPPRFLNSRPFEQQPTTAKADPVKPQQPRSRMTYGNTQPRQLPTVVYPGKNSEPDTTKNVSSDRPVNGYASAKPESVSQRLNPMANCNRNTAEPSALERSKTKPESAAHRLEKAILSSNSKRQDSGINDNCGGWGDGRHVDTISWTSSSKSFQDQGAARACQSQPATTKFNNSAGVNYSDSSPDQLSAWFADIQIKKAPSQVGNMVYPSLTPPSAGPVYSAESAAQTNQRAFLMGLDRQKRIENLSGPAAKPKPGLSAWDPNPVVAPLTSPTVPSFEFKYQDADASVPYAAALNSVPAPLSFAPSATSPLLSGQVKSWDVGASMPHAAALNSVPAPLSFAPSATSPLLSGQVKSWDVGASMPHAATSPPAEPIGASLGLLQISQPRGPTKPLKPMDRLLRQNLDNAESARARLTLEQEVERERCRLLGLKPPAETTAPPRASISPAVSVPADYNPVVQVASNTATYNSVRSDTPPNIMCDWERQSALITIKPLYNNAQFIGDNLLMQVAKLELGLEHQFVRAEGVPYRLGLCISGLTLEQAVVEVKQQRAVYPNVVVCLGSIDILMNCELSDICRQMLHFLRLLTDQELMVQRIYVCNLPPLPTATSLQRETLVQFNRWLGTFCSIGNIYQLCDIFSAFLDERYQIHSQYYMSPVRVNMGGDCIVQLQPWSQVGCRAFLDTLRASLTHGQQS